MKKKEWKVYVSCPLSWSLCDCNITHIRKRKEKKQTKISGGIRKKSSKKKRKLIYYSSRRHSHTLENEWVSKWEWQREKRLNEKSQEKEFCSFVSFSSCWYTVNVYVWCGKAWNEAEKFSRVCHVTSVNVHFLNRILNQVEWSQKNHFHDFFFRFFSILFLSPCDRYNKTHLRNWFCLFFFFLISFSFLEN